ncbi:hypothetical protein MKW94_021935 [Papaver nudicaule]|uniref:NADH-quinone oxidoreductase subunit D domain-containing protein n=1 Tax=Papaver nudicaule TaxID=74823 RepID=A0AA41SBE3_PAPNU|nr:hypothetical protein [Papaver nudicaule]
MTVSATRKDLMIVNMGPHHPSMHDDIDCEPILGYLHRGMEKIAENRTIIQYLPYVTRWDYLATMFTEAITVNGPEYRIASHLLWLGPFMADIGAQTPFFYIFRERELIYDLFEAATGMRMMHNYFRIGGVAADLPHGWIDKCLYFCDYFLTGLRGSALLVEEAINWGLSGPMLRASGIQWDLRKVDHYECYDEFDWDVQYPTRRFDKARDSDWNDFDYRFISKKASPCFELSKQELYVRVEAPKGELGFFFLIGDHSAFPWRWKIRPPGFINLQILPHLVKRMKLADIMTILGSIDIIMGEVDR